MKNVITSIKIKSNRLLALLLMSSVAFVSCSKETDDAVKKTPVEASDEMPSGELKIDDFTLNDTDGNAVTLSDYAGKTIVLFFFGYNCPSCKAIAPSVSELKWNYYFLV